MMASTTLPADRLKAACEKAARGLQLTGNQNLATVLAILHLSSAALSVNANAALTITSEEFVLLAENW